MKQKAQRVDEHCNDQIQACLRAPWKPMTCFQTEARLCWGAHWIIRRPMMSCETTVCTSVPPTIFTSGSLSRSQTSATMWPCVPACFCHYM